MASPSRFTPGRATVASDLVVEVELTISAKNLLNKDALSKSDPLCVVYVQQRSTQAWKEHGRTEVLQNTLNPDFATKILIGYRFEEQQKLKLKIFDIDSSDPILENHDFLGEAECTLGQIVSAKYFAAPVLHPGSKARNQQTLHVSVEEVGPDKEEVEFVVSSQGLRKTGIFSKPDPFFAIYKDGNHLVYRTTFLKDSLNPRWPKFVVPLRALCSDAGFDTILSLQVWNYNRNGNHQLIGEAQTTTDKIIENPFTPVSFSLTCNKIKKSSKGSPGKLIIHQAVVKRIYSFLDYISGRTRISCTIAIDFTASNGAPNEPNSLHYMGPTPTLYERALQSVVTIIQDYDADKYYPVLGFGAKIPPAGTLQHEFFVSLTKNPFCAGVGGVIQAYRRCLPLVQFFGPTNFAPVIKHVTRFAAAYTNGVHYFILLILTDGAISDMHDTKRAIIDASSLPLSIIIVGIGNADFSSMDELDSDNGMLSCDGKTASRDIVQFVPFRDFLLHSDPAAAANELARALLAEVPNQLVSFMQSKNLAPL